MGLKRQKAYRKLLNQYALSFGFRPPYQVLCTADLLIAAYRCKMNLGHLLQKTLSEEVKPLISQCCIRHLYTMEANTPAEKAEKNICIDVAKEFERRRCGHHNLDEPLTAEECLISMMDPKENGSNKHRYVVATQDSKVRQRLRRIAGVPLVYINRSVMILEPMAAKTEEVRNADEKSKIRAGLKSIRSTGPGGVKRKRVDEEEENADMPARAKAIAAAAGGENGSGPAQKKRKAKGPKGPNPLSVKKVKKEKEKPSPKQVEDERSTIRKATKSDSQAAEKAVSAEVAAEQGATDEATEGQRKRKRKRKGKEGHVEGGEDVNAGAEVAVSG